MQKRNNKGQFKKDLGYIEETFSMLRLVYMIIPLIIGIVIILNRTGAWGILGEIHRQFSNIGNPNCKYVCHGDLKEQKNDGGDDVE